MKISRNKKLDKIAIIKPGHRCLQRAKSTHISQDLSPVQPKRRRSMDLLKIRSILKIPHGKPRSIFGRCKSVNFAAQDDLSCAIDETNDQSFQDNPTPPSQNDVLLIDFSDGDSNVPNQGNNSNANPLTRDTIDTKKSAQTNGEGQSMNIQFQSLLDEFDPLLNSVGAQKQITAGSNLHNANVVSIF